MSAFVFCCSRKQEVLKLAEADALPGIVERKAEITRKAGADIDCPQCGARACRPAPRSGRNRCLAEMQHCRQGGAPELKSSRRWPPKPEN